MKNEDGSVQIWVTLGLMMGDLNGHEIVGKSTHTTTYNIIINFLAMVQKKLLLVYIMYLMQIAQCTLHIYKMYVCVQRTHNRQTLKTNNS